MLEAIGNDCMEWKHDIGNNCILNTANFSSMTCL